MVRTTLLGIALGAAALGAGCAAAPAPQAPASAAGAQRPASQAAAPRASGAAAAAPLTPVATPAAPPQMAALARRLAMVIDGAKPQVTTFPLDLDALPRITMHAALDAKDAAKLDRSKLTEDPDLQVKPADGYARQYMLSISFKDASKIAYARVRVAGTYGAADGWFGEGFGSSMSTYMTCGVGGDLVPIHWDMVQMEKDQVAYTSSDGVLDRQNCRVLGVRKSSAKAKPLLPRGILFGFRSCEGSCAENEELTLLFPRSSATAAGALGGGAERATGSFSIVSFPIQRGGGGAFIARISRRDAASWQIAASGAAEKAAPQPIDTARMSAALLPNFELGVEVSQTRDDEAPVALAYMDIDPATLPPPPAPAKPQPTAQAQSSSNINISLDPFGNRR